MEHQLQKRGIWNTLCKHKVLYFMLIPGVLYFLIFCYLPMYGVVIAFQDFYPSQGIQGMLFEPNWVGFKYFKQFFGSHYFTRTLMNTLILFFAKFLTSFPASIILALLINEVMGRKFKKAVQTISYIPYFLSMVTVAGIVVTLLNPTSGIVNQIIESFGGEPTAFISDPRYIRTILVVMNLWKNVGWGSIIYLAAFAGVDTQLYECARIEGASKLQQIWYITLPSISFIISIQLIMNVGGLLSAGFEDIILLYSPATYNVVDVIDTFVYREGLINMNFSYSTAVGLFKSLVGLILVLGTNFATKKLGYDGIW